jgi:hypothetical protein
MVGRLTSKLAEGHDLVVVTTILIEGQMVGGSLSGKVTSTERLPFALARKLVCDKLLCYES